MAAARDVVPEGFPPQFGLPPFFTLQPVAATRATQLELWSQLIVAHCERARAAVLELGGPSGKSTPFANPAIGRALDAEGRRAVADALVSGGRAQWVKGKGAAGVDDARILVLWRPLSQWADEAHGALRAGAVGGAAVFTMHELLSAGGALGGTALDGLAPELVGAVVEELVRQGRAQTFGGAGDGRLPHEDEELGVKLL